MKKIDLELCVGLFVIAGMLSLAYLSFRMGDLELFGKKGYEVYAVFADSGGIRSGAGVAIAGVEVGKVQQVVLDDYQAKIWISVPNEIKLPKDSIAAVKTRGVIGEKFIEIVPGGDEKMLGPGDKIVETQPALDVEKLISSYVFGKL
jgi:phospholipid/cholesterol/gamma-HCH transport system substrate-binding protein